MEVWRRFGWAIAIPAGFLCPLVLILLFWLNGFIPWTIPIGQDFGIGVASIILSVAASVLLLVIAILRWLALRRGGREIAAAILFGFGAVLSLLPSLYADHHLKFLTAAYLADRGAPIVAAIESYVAKEGRPPADLHDLVPGYLEEVPWTGSSLYPDYNLVTGADTFAGNPWMLEIQMFAVLKWDALYYCPRQNCLESNGAGGLMPVGNWVFLDE